MASNTDQPAVLSDTSVQVGCKDAAVMANDPVVLPNGQTEGKLKESEYSYVAIPMSKRSSVDDPTSGDAYPSDGWLRNKGLERKTYKIFKFNVYNYDEYLKWKHGKSAIGRDIVAKDAIAIDSFELSFEPLLSPSRHSILFDNQEYEREIYYDAENASEYRNIKFALRLRDIGRAKLTCPTAPNEGLDSVGIHGGGAYYSTQCATSPRKEFDPKASSAELLNEEEKKAHPNKKYRANQKLLAFEAWFLERMKMDKEQDKAMIVLPAGEGSYADIADSQAQAPEEEANMPEKL